MRLFIKCTPTSGLCDSVLLVIDLDSAREQLSPIHEPVSEAYKAAVGCWGELIEESPHLVLPFDATARANVIHPHIQREVQLRIDGISGVEPTDALGFFALRVGTEILLRFKYVGRGFPSNVKTMQQRLLANQTYDEDMMMRLTGDPQFTPPTLLTAGYTLDGIELSRVEIRCDCKWHLAWSYDIYGDGAVVEPLLVPGLEDTTRPARIVSRKAQREAEERADQA